ncbi:hypothetical protein N0V83_004762 [Neocucurbitaria cava]|uniref:Uncharacterized protein n=1 Tax=Neocucurbitaria cava TaxID=798079 RepID=A0A9W8YC49_9PLEO|nr:hypothetical protein N0V83_004762 [Neocucurbitaria cava]
MLPDRPVGKIDRPGYAPAVSEEVAASVSIDLSRIPWCERGMSEAPEVAESTNTAAEDEIEEITRGVAGLDHDAEDEDMPHVEVVDVTAVLGAASLEHTEEMPDCTGKSDCTDEQSNGTDEKTDRTEAMPDATSSTPSLKRKRPILPAISPYAQKRRRATGRFTPNSTEITMKDTIWIPVPQPCPSKKRQADLFDVKISSSDDDNDFQVASGRKVKRMRGKYHFRGK